MSLTFNSYPADYTLRDKIGSVKITAEQLKSIREASLSCRPTIRPLIRKSLKSIKEALEALSSLSYERETYLPRIIRDVMDIKSLAGMFEDKALSQPAALLQDFLEEVHTLNADVTEIISGFLHISAQILGTAKRDDYETAKYLTALEASCVRYREKAAKNRGV